MSTPPSDSNLSYRDVYLLRHGRTPLNADGRLRGRIDTPLDSVGLLEAASLGELFAMVPLAMIVSSPLSRAVATADAVARHHPHLQVQIDPDLTDRDWGPWAGHPETEIVERFGRADDAPGVENFGEFQQRTLAAIERVAQGAAERPVLAVAHDAVNRAVLGGLIVGLGTGPIEQHTGCWNHLVYDSLHWTVTVLNAVPGDNQRP